MAGINRFKASFTDLARPNRFEVRAQILGSDVRFLAKGSSLPGATLGAMEVPYQGRVIKLAGDRTYDDWEITCFQDDQADIRNRCDEWMRKALEHESNIGALSHSTYKEDMTVVQLNRADIPIMEYKLIGCVPITVGPLDMQWDSNDTPAEFSLSVAYDYYEIQ